MDRALLLDHLALALPQLAGCQRDIAQQHAHIASLERVGLYTRDARAELRLLEELLGMLVETSDRPKKELAASSETSLAKQSVQQAREAPRPQPWLYPRLPSITWR